jgi:hypothetical protein
MIFALRDMTATDIAEHIRKIVIRIDLKNQLHQFAA